LGEKGSSIEKRRIIKEGGREGKMRGERDKDGERPVVENYRRGLGTRRKLRRCQKFF
jgi:hypothetical protein